MSRCLFLFPLLFPFLTSAQSWKNELDSVLQVLTAQVQFHGQVLLADSGRIQFASSYGAAPTAEPVGLHTPLPMASISKSVSAYMALQLSQQNRLDLDARVTKYLPNFPYKQVTVRQLINQTSGLPRFLETALAKADTAKLMQNADLLALIEKERPQADAPLKSFRYNNSNYIVLGSVLEAAANKPFAQLLNELVLLPYGMFSTYDNASRILAAHSPGKRYKLDTFYKAAGSGSLYSTAPDIYRFLQVLRQQELAKGAESELVNRPLLSNGDTSHYTLGLFYRPADYPFQFTHTGAADDGENFVGFNRDNAQVMLVFHHYSHTYAKAVRQMIFNIWNGEPYTLPEKRVLAQVPEQVLIKYVGSYLSGFGLVHVSLDKGKLYLRPDPVPGKEELVPSSETTFYFNNQDLHWEFFLNADGSVMGFGIKGQPDSMGLPVKN